MKPGHLKLAKTASSATSLRAAVAAVVVEVTKIRVVAAAVISGEIAEVETKISRSKRSAIIGGHSPDRQFVLRSVDSDRCLSGLPTCRVPGLADNARKPTLSQGL